MRVTRIISLLAGFLTFLTVSVPPVTYLVFSYRYIEGNIETAAEFSAHAVTELVAKNPEMWRFEHVRLVEFLSRSSSGGEPETRRVLDDRGRLIAESPGSAPAPRITTSLPIFDAGVAVGSVQITRSLRPAVLRTVAFALALLPLGFIVFAVIRTIPLRAIRRSAEALTRSEARFRALIEKSTDMIVLLDAQMRIQFWSPSATETMGWTAEEMRGRRALECIHDDDRQRVLAAFAGVVAQPGGAMHADLRFRHRDGSWRLLEAFGRSLLDDPAVQGVVVNTRDVTEQRRLEEQFQQGQKLESIGRLAGGVAHDFNNLLTVILGCTESLKESLSGGAPGLAEVEDIHSAAERARDLTRHLLAFARKQVFAPVPLDLNAVLRGSERLLRRMVGEDVAVVVKLAPDLWPTRCDPAQIEQVVVNLAANARDSIARTGTLTVETCNVHVGAADAVRFADQPAGDYVRLTVSDSGAGLSPEVKAHLFEPFFTTKPKGRGTGLGLAMVYGIVKQSGGMIHVQSEPGAGTAFELYFPRSPDAVVGAAAPLPVKGTRGSETLFVVEDDPLVREFTVRPLRAAGYRVLVASSGVEALEIADDELRTVRLLVTDVIMPGLDGRALAEALCRRHAELQVLYVSGYTQGAIAERGVLDSGIHFLQKPFSASSLLAKVRGLLDSGCGTRSAASA